MRCTVCLGLNPTLDMMHFHVEKFSSDQKKPWAARIVGVEEKGLLKREFLNGLNDYTNAAKFGRRLTDIEMNFVFRVGWVVETYGPGNPRSYFMIVSPTEKESMTAKEVLQWALIQQNAR